MEWATFSSPYYLVEDFENIVDKAVNELQFPLVCAYSGDKMPEHLQNIIERTHPYLLKGNELAFSNKYKDF